MARSYEVSVSNYPAIGMDAELNFAGPGAGVAQGGGESNQKGIVSITGNRIAINEVPGADSIEIAHFTGAQIVIDPDGSIFLMPSSKKGFGIHSERGDGLISAKNTLVIKGVSNIICETDGDMQLNVGKNLYFNVGGNVIQNVKGSYNTCVEGSSITQVAGDDTKIVAGVNRLTVAGSYWTQVSSSCSFDVRGDYTIRAKTQSIQSNTDIRVLSNKTEFLGDSVEVNTTESFKVNSGNVEIGGTETKVTGENSAIFAGKNTKVSGESLQTVASGSLNLSGGSITVNKPVTGNPSVPLGPDLSPDSSIAISEKTKTEVIPIVAEANTVIDIVTSVRRNPSIAMNLLRTPGSQISVLRNEGGQLTPDANRMQFSNSRSSNIESVPGTVHSPSQNSKKAEKTSYSQISSVHNASEKLSKNVTVGMFPGISKIPESFGGLSRTQILENIQNLCFNVLDPVFTHFGSRVSFTTLGGWRPESKNHNSGRAALS